jgi:transposase-like protein
MTMALTVRQAKSIEAVDEPMCLPTLMTDFGTGERCRMALELLRWPNGVACPRCGGMTVSRIVKRSQFDCDSCRYQFSVTAGTIFHDSHLPLSKWFLATYIITESRKGVSSNQLKRMLKVSYKTAWYLTHRIRAAMKEDDAPLLTGEVEADESWIGGRRKGRGKGNWRQDKTMVMGALSRGGEVRFKVEKRPIKTTIHKFLDENVSRDATALFTDELMSYNGWVDADTRHGSVVHKDEEWVRGDIHTNGIEGVWSLFKRSIVGSYHQLSAKHMDAYLDEMAWRFNNRDNPYLFRDTLLRLIRAESLPYQQLIEEPA